MVDRNKELAINTVILGIGQLIPKFLAIMLLPLLTSYLTTEEYGNYDLILSIASLLIPVVTMQYFVTCLHRRALKIKRFM